MSGNQPGGRGGSDQPQSGSGQRQGRQGGQRQGGQRQGGQRQGRQQGGQRRGGQQGRQRQGGQRRPPGGGGQGGGGIDTGFATSAAVIGGGGGVVFGLMMWLMGQVGGLPVLPGATDRARTLAESQGTGAVFDTALSLTHQTLITYLTTELAPFVAFGIAIVIGVLAVQLSEDVNQLASAAAGMAVGGFLFVFLPSLILGLLGPDANALIQAAAQAQGGSPGQVSPAGGFDTALASPQFVNIALNSVVVGVGSAATAALTVFSIKQFN